MLTRSVLCAACAVASLSPASAQCVEFSTGFGGPGLSDAVMDFATFGGELFAAGEFTQGDERLMQGVARWDGSAWSAVGGGIEGIGRRLCTVAGAGAGAGGERLYVSGAFVEAGGLPASYIAAWDGTRWSALQGSFGEGLPGSGAVLEAYDDGSGPRLFVTTPKAGGLSTQGLAAWDGSEWSAPALPAAIQFPPAMVVHDWGAGDELWVTLAASQLWSWNGASWTARPPVPIGQVVDMTVFDDGGGEKLYACTLDHVYRLGASSWTQIASATSLSFSPFPLLYQLRGFPDDAGGPTLWACGLSILSRWNGSTWSYAPTTGGLWPYQSIQTLFSHDAGGASELVVGGPFYSSLSTVATTTVVSSLTARSVARWTGSTWEAMGNEPEGLDRHGEALAVYDGGAGPALFVGGAFEHVAGTPAAHLVRWTGQWEFMDDVPDGDVLALYVHDDGLGPELIAGGSFSAVGALEAGKIAAWNGESWRSLGPGLAGGNVWALGSFDLGSGEQLVAGGGFTSSGSEALSRLAVWDGTAWAELGGGVTGGLVRALASFDDGSGERLFAAGAFTKAGGVPVGHIAAWDGSAWADLGGGMDDDVRALCVFDDGSGPRLYAGGVFATAGGQAAASIAAWDGAQWSPVGPGFLGTVRSMAVWGGALWTGGAHLPGGTGIGRRLQRWDGVSWTDPGEVSDLVRALATYDDGAGEALFLTGDFELVDHFGPKQLYAEHFARYGPEDTCPPASYCTAGTTASGCQATMRAIGEASRSLPAGCLVEATEVEGLQDGILYFGASPKATPWGSGASYQCVSVPAQRTPLQNSGGLSGTCEGLLGLDFNAYMTANPSKAPPAGTQVHFQAWFRDPPSPKGTSFSDGISLWVRP